MAAERGSAGAQKSAPCRVRRRRLVEVPPAAGGGHPAPGRPVEEALLHQERLVDVLHRLALLAHARGDGVQAHRAAAELLEDGEEDLPVHRVEARSGRPPAAPARRAATSRATRRTPATSAKSRMRRSSRLAMRGVPRERVAISRAPSSASCTPRMPALRARIGLEVRRGVVVEPLLDLEAVAQRRGEEPGAGGGPHQGEGRQVDLHRPGRGAGVDGDVEPEVLHRRVEVLLDRRGQPVDLVDEEDVARLEVGEQPGQVALPLQRRARR